MTLSFGGGAGVLTIPGLSSDGLIPGGIIVEGGIVAGNTNGPGILTTHEFTGLTVLYATPEGIAVGDNTLTVETNGPLTADTASSGLVVERHHTLNGHTIDSPLVVVTDTSGATNDLQRWNNAGGVAAAIGQAGGLGLFGHAVPTAPRTLAQATITAITDANAKAAVQVCANALADMGVLTLT